MARRDPQTAMKLRCTEGEDRRLASRWSYSQVNVVIRPNSVESKQATKGTTLMLNWNISCYSRCYLRLFYFEHICSIR
ncbi:hypothetical protein [Paenibacillus illinoisensis]|uniref:hypothetical protein n=1 Tax=Paenibacillus illinoisensis TaxID=59845 RepID=UPI00301E3D1D